MSPQIAQISQICKCFKTTLIFCEICAISGYINTFKGAYYEIIVSHGCQLFAFVRLR